MRARGLASPDDADSFALTFAVKVARKDKHLMNGQKQELESLREWIIIYLEANVESLYARYLKERRKTNHRR